MPLSPIMKTGDKLVIIVPPPTIIPEVAAPIPLVGTSSNTKIKGKPICLLGDELPPALRKPLSYSVGAAVGGLGTFRIVLAPDNLTKIAKNGKPVLLQGRSFQAIFTTTKPAQTPNGVPTPAPPTYSASFLDDTPQYQAG